MRAVTALAVTVFILVLAGTATAASTPIGTLRAQDTLTRAGKFQQAYQLFSPRFRAKCLYAKWVKGAPATRQALVGAVLKVGGAQYNQGGDRATLSYKYVKGGQVIYSTTSDLYVEINGQWYDELDAGTQC